MRLHPDCEDECQVAAARGPSKSCHIAGRVCAQLECEEYDAQREAERLGLDQASEEREP